ncbi:efflux transporter [Ganoderma leucocontextum]|nr:efflux transporter [Ganoderma leucocontextum]
MSTHQRSASATSARLSAEKDQEKESDITSTYARKDDHSIAHVKRSMAKDIVLIGTVTLAMILNIANMTAVSISLPTIGSDLNIIESMLQWIVSAYSLSSGCLLSFLGRLADLFGRKLTFILGCAWMGIFGLGCGFAQDEITIDILRALQGLGPAAASRCECCFHTHHHQLPHVAHPLQLGILVHTFPPSHIRSVAFATFAAGAPVGGALGSTVGGVLTQLTAAMCCLGGYISIEADVPYTLPDKRLDWVGAFLVTAGLTFIVFILSDGSIAPDGWRTGYIIALVIVGVFSLVLFVFWERYLEQVHMQGGEVSQKWWTPPPLMPVSIWGRANGKVAAVLVIAFVESLEWCSFSGFTFWVQLYYQEYLNLSPILTMVRLLPMQVTGVTCNVVIALIVAHASLVYLATIGTLFTATANLLFAVIVPSTPYWAFGFPAVVLCVFGADFFFSTGTLFIARACLPHEQSVGGALFQTLTQLGTAFGLAISTVVFNATLRAKERDLGIGANVEGTNAPREAQLAAYKGAMWSGFAFGVFGMLLAVLFLRGVGVVGHRKGDTYDESEKPAARGDPKAVRP